MKQLFPSTFGDVSDGSFGQAIMEVSAYATIGESLLPGGAMVDEDVVCKLAVVCIVVLDLDEVVGGELFKS
jgi:hypothetical protein